MTTTKTVGTSGADFTSIASAVSWITSNVTSGGSLTDDVVIAVKAIGLSPAASDNISGWAAGGHTTKLTANTGDSFRDNANKLTNALKYTSANGAFVDYSGTSAHTLTISVSSATISNLQIKTGGIYSVSVNFGATTDGLLDSSIVYASNGASNLNFNGTAGVCRARNNLFLADAAISRQADLVQFTTNSSSCFFQDNTVACTTAGGALGSTSAVGLFVNAYGVYTITGNVIAIRGTVTFDIEVANHGSTASLFANNNATDLSSLTSNIGAPTGSNTGNQVSLTRSTEFTSDGSDFRLAAGSVKCKGHGTTISGITTDIVGTTRSAGSEDIGAWQTASAAAFNATRFMIFFP